MIELLAPAGDERSFFAAINSGANAVYLGMSDFSARKNAENFNSDNINYYVSYAHALGVRVYVAINTLIKDGELHHLLQTVSACYSANVDAFILQDVFLADLLKENFPQIVLHLSTQAGINEVGGAEFAKKAGFSRVILSRETELKEISQIAKIIETEVFVHGALCSSFSGHCYMSAYVGGNSGNRGLCKQPCRKEYSLEKSSKKGKYAISLSDLCLISELKALKNIGVASIKIEGRMRSPEYVAEAVGAYRRALDKEEYDLSRLKRTFNRGNFTKGYLCGVNSDIVFDKIQNHCGESVAKIEKVVGDKIFTNRHSLKGDAFKILSDGFEVGNAVCNENGKVLLFKGKAKIGDGLNITKDVSLGSINQTKKKKLKVFARVVENDYLTLEAEGIKVTSEQIIEAAKNSPITVEEVISNLNKTDVYPFEILADVNIVGKPFVAKSILNKLRATLYKKVFFKDVKPLKNTYNIDDFTTNYTSRYSRLVLTDELVRVDDNNAFILHPTNYTNADNIDRILDKVTADKYIFVPSFLPDKDKEIIVSLLDKFDGIYADGLSGISLAKRYNKKLIAGLGLNAFNKIDLKRLSEECQAVILSQELGQFEIEALSRSCHTFTFGSIRLMELMYCPFGKNCSKCKKEQDFFTLTDKLGHKFKVRRYKINSNCRFEVYNEQILYAGNKEKAFISLVGLDKSTYENYLNSDEKAIKSRYSVTNGNLKRGVN